MSALDEFVERPAIRQAFDDHVQNWSGWMQVLQARATGPALHPKHSDRAFHYLVQFELARWCIEARLNGVRTPWLAHLGLHNLACRPELEALASRWGAFLVKAQARIDAYLQGQEVPLEDRIHVAWSLARLETLYWEPYAKAALVRPVPPSPAVLRQLTEWVTTWTRDWENLEHPVHRALLNPEFNWMPGAGNSQITAVLDDAVLGLHCSQRSSTPSQIRKLVGQVALSHLVGLHLPGHPELADPIRYLGFYRVRAAEGERWAVLDVVDLFPGEHWMGYLESFARELQVAGEQFRASKSTG